MVFIFVRFFTGKKTRQVNDENISKETDLRDFKCINK